MRKRGLARLDKTKNAKKNYLTGLTLMEIIVSLVLVAVTLLGLTHLFVTGKRYVQYSLTKMTGGELGKVFLDPLQMNVRQDQWGSNCLSMAADPPAGCPGPQTIDDVLYTPDYNIDDLPGTGLRRVRLNISWPNI